MEKLVVCDINSIIDNNSISQMIENLPQSRKDKYFSCTNEKQKNTTIAGYYLIKQLLGLTENKDYEYLEFGKPYIPNEMHFNISHSGDLIAVAISSNPIGIDIQKNIDYKDKLAKKISSTKQYMSIQNSADKSIALTKLWVTKESYIKLIGSSILKDLKKIRTKEPNCKYKYYTYKNYQICVCEYKNNQI